MEDVKLAVMGAGLIGRRHAEHIAAQRCARLTAIIDPSPIGKEVAEGLGARCFASLSELVAKEPPDGIIIATPNQLHLEHGLEAVAAGIPAIVEKPIADNVAAASKLVDAAEHAGVPLLVGHHRRYNPMIRKAKEIIESGRLGRVLALHGCFWVSKPDDYFEVAWRRERGAGPVFLNLIHDIDLFRYLCGDIVSVQALESNVVRGHAVEQSAVILLEFANGARHGERLGCGRSALELGAHLGRKSGLPASGPVLLPDRRHACLALDPAARAVVQPRQAQLVGAAHPRADRVRARGSARGADPPLLRGDPWNGGTIRACARRARDLEGRRGRQAIGTQRLENQHRWHMIGGRTSITAPIYDPTREHPRLSVLSTLSGEILRRRACFSRASASPAGSIVGFNDHIGSRRAQALLSPSRAQFYFSSYLKDTFTFAR